MVVNYDVFTNYVATQMTSKLDQLTITGKGKIYTLLYQVRTMRPACVLFLEITFIHKCLRACVCVYAPETINNQWHDFDLIRLVE